MNHHKRPDLAIIKNFVSNVKSNIKSNTLKLELAEMMSFLTKTQLQFLSQMLKLNKKLHEERLKGYLNAGYYAGRLEVKLVSDGIIGIGGGPFKAIFEVGLNVDPITGLPYYPGSGLKGAVRSFVERYSEDLASALFGETGTEGHASLVVYSDLIPIGCPKEPCSIFKGLVLNPHYYRGGQVVENELEVTPVPIIHVGIPRGLVFGTVIALRRVPKMIENTLGELKKIVEKHRDEQPWSTMTRLVQGNDVRESLMLSLAFLTLYVLKRGISARSSKNYNKFEPFECEDLNNCLTFNVKSWEVRLDTYKPKDSKDTKKHHQKLPKGPSTYPKTYGKRRQSRR